MSDYIPPELQIEVLKRLPTKSIIQCLSVCKSWNSMIKSPNFVAAQLDRVAKMEESSEDQTFLIRYFDKLDKSEKYILGKDDETFGENFVRIEFPFKSYIGYFRVIASCCGLLCLCDDLFSNLHDVIIWNPAIRKSVRVILPRVPDWPHVAVVGFGVCPVTKDPKLVMVVCVKDSSHVVHSPAEVQVFALSVGEWRKPKCVAPPCYLIEFTWSQAFVNGCINWIGYNKRAEGGSRNLILSFDLYNEVFEEVTLPDVLACQPFSNLSIVPLKDSVALLEYDREVENMVSCAVWVLKGKNDSASWSKLIKIALSPPTSLSRIVGFRKNGNLLLALANNALVSYEPQEGELKSLGLSGNIRSFFVDAYMETLLLVNYENGLLEGQRGIYVGIDEDEFR